MQLTKLVLTASSYCYDDGINVEMNELKHLLPQNIRHRYKQKHDIIGKRQSQEA